MHWQGLCSAQCRGNRHPLRLKETQAFWKPLFYKQAQQQVAQDLAKQADNDPILLGKLVKWGQSLGNSAATLTLV